jgi:hypothetical protein
MGFATFQSSAIILGLTMRTATLSLGGQKVTCGELWRGLFSKWGRPSERGGQASPFVQP